MAQPPPRKGAYNKFVVNLHKEQYSKLQAKHQQELDLLDDIRNFMKQRAAIEKHYAEGLAKLSSVYGNKKIATIEDLVPEAKVNENEHNIYQLWRIILDENEKISKARLAAVGVFQENISDDAKNIRAWKNLNAKRSLDRLSVIQRDIQHSVSEVDRTKRTYFCEETDALDTASKAQDADLKSRGLKKDVRSLFQSKSALKKKAVLLSARQDETEIKSTGSRNDYLLSLVTANAHQDRYFHYDLQYTIREMEAGIYEKMSEYFGTFARTELLTCGALQNSFGKIKEGAETINREYNYRCYIKAFPSLGDHVQYAFEAVEGDTINTITPSEHDAGYSLNYAARDTASKLNQAVKTIRAYNKRIKACRIHKSKGLKQEPNDPNGPNLDDKILELETAIRKAETDRAKCEAKLNKLREGDVAVDEYLDSASITAYEKEVEEQAGPTDWGSSSNTMPQEDTPYAEASFDQQGDTSGMVMENGGSPEDVINEEAGWGETAEPAQDADWANQNTWVDDGGWKDEPAEEAAPEETPAVTEDQPDQENNPQIEIDPNAEVWKAVSLFLFDGQNEDELTVAENEEVDILVKECDEEGWVMTRNKSGQKGYVPYNYIQVYDFVMKDDSPFASTQERSNSISSSSGQVVRQPSIESTASWGFPGGSVMPSIPEQSAVQEQEYNSSDTEEDEDSEESGPPGMGPPPGPPPMATPPEINISSLGTDDKKRNSRPISIQFGASMDSEYCKALYDYDANGSDELAFKEDDVIHIISRSPHGVEDGWWMGGLDGRSGLFPSIVVEECQANGDDWSPDVSMGSPTSIGPPCFTPPPLDAPPGLPPAPPASYTAPPPLPAAPPPALPSAPPPALPAGQPPERPAAPPQAMPAAPPPGRPGAPPPAMPAAPPPAMPAAPPPAMPAAPPLTMPAAPLPTIPAALPPAMPAAPPQSLPAAPPPAMPAAPPPSMPAAPPPAMPAAPPPSMPPAPPPAMPAAPPPSMPAAPPQGMPSAPPPAMPAAPTPAAPPKALPAAAVPALPTATPPTKSVASSQAKPAGPPANVSAPSGLMAPDTQIMITNPTPVVEDSADVREEPPVSYHVEDRSFSMTMSKERRIKYKQESGVPEVEVTVDEVPTIAISIDEPEPECEPPTTSSQQQPEVAVSITAEPADNNFLAFTEITVTAPTPRVQSPEEETAEFPVAEDISSTTVQEKLEDDQSKGDEVKSSSNNDSWAAFGEPAKDTSADTSGADWANFPPPASQPDEPVKQQESKLPASIVADLQESDDSDEAPVVEKKKKAAAKKPAVDGASKKKVDSDSDEDEGGDREDSDDMRSDREEAADSSEDETESEKKSGMHARTSSDSSDTDDDAGGRGAAQKTRKRATKATTDDSSDTESGTEDNSSLQSSPRKPKQENIRLPPEDFEPKQLKKLETMKESPA